MNHRRMDLNHLMSTSYPRDLVGYGRNAPHPHWPSVANGLRAAFESPSHGLESPDEHFLPARPRRLWP
ncbi:hypothetical protein BOS5A_90039 [Bosea sp. EC-HK365B]|nr:hypothetical protein BOSE7B_20001 [Bosea sp. 7B]CAD5270046.1 hypothetical protein BOSE21B_111636 [Bosea sp. 21B]VVT62585.1 hypothetical protein BOS5A_90039 [Bosea sp. EC-HK365B]VXC43830.1 hypothetical protein BOSE125_200201 [Bosea sp. 125]VXC60953.1 hypothetical protein BOSE127_30014 [Bosea sp. 127]